MNSWGNDRRSDALVSVLLPHRNTSLLAPQSCMQIHGQSVLDNSYLHVRSHPSLPKTPTSPPLHNFGRNVLFDTFLRTLERTNSWIVGSVALAAASTLSDPPHPRNLNLISYRGNFESWIDFLGRSGFQLRARRWSSGPYAVPGSWRCLFTHKGIPRLCVTITFSVRRNLGHLFFASPNTDQMVAIGPYEIITPVLRNVSEQQHIQGWRKQMHSLHIDPLYGRFYRVNSRFPGAVTLDGSTVGWGRPCGMSCPGRWRSAQGLKGFAHIKWGGLDGANEKTDTSLQVLGESHLLFRFGVGCCNNFCPNSPTYLGS
ncbi:hypothetical protein R3P38DRAFT_2799103 [Favolaschia claudopus]|uniref:Uncharacterized protein n=1 Tax=Favolaschia claudopus TaxID=2862362 RepID=A0AAW0A1L4_9AGAR